MTRSDFNELMESTFAECKRLNATKGADYAGNEDALSNFKRHGENLGLTPEQIWAVYSSKHWDAVLAYCRNGQVESEPIAGRIDDLITYLVLLKALTLDLQYGDRKKEKS